MNKIPKERLIFSNYDVSDTYDDVREFLIAESEEENYEPSDQEVLEQADFENMIWWEDTRSELRDFVERESEHWLCVGSVGRWDGVYHGGFVFNQFHQLMNKATEDCDYWKFYDENGHLYLHCSHHDGSCSFEIKKLTDEGWQYLQNWEYGNYSDKRTQSYVYCQLLERYSRLPNFAHKVYGLPRTEFEPQSKEAFMRILNNQAKSCYC